MDQRTITEMALDRFRTALDQVWPRWADPIADDGYGDTDLHKASAPLARRFVTAVDGALDGLATGAREAATAHGQVFYTPEERQRRAAQALQDGRDEYDRQLRAATTALDELSQRVRAAGVPQRPQPADAAQEAALGNERTDLRMILDPVPALGLSQRLVDLVADAAANGNRLRVWLLASSGWAGDYLRARGVPEAVELTRMNIAPGLAPTASKQVREALAVWPLLEVGPGAARRLVDVHLPVVFEEESSDVAAVTS